MWSSEYTPVEWNWAFRVECFWSSRWYCPLNIPDFRVMFLGRTSRSGLLPYPRYMPSSLAPEWFRVRVEKRVEDGSDPVFTLRERFAWINEPRNDFDFIFSRLDPFPNCRVNFVDKLQLWTWYEIFGAIDCTVVPGSHGIRNLEKRAGRRGPQ
jgi:hypothetical protein